MKLDAIKLGLATALAFALVWLVCSLLVGLWPGGMMSMSGSMMHSDFSGMNWHLSWGGVILGMIGWTILVGIFAWLLAAIYNALLSAD